MPEDRLHRLHESDIDTGDFNQSRNSTPTSKIARLQMFCFADASSYAPKASVAK